MSESQNLQDKIAQLPQKPGVYIYKNDNDIIIYVGKAIKLKNRVKSYFVQGKQRDAKTKALVAKISDLEYIVTDTEAEALILEDTLIKQHKPRYNVLLRDDKTYPYIRLTKEPYPRVFQTRTVVRDGSKYFGPFPDSNNAKRLIKLTNNLLKIRSCELKMTPDTVRQGKHKLCLDYHIGKCEGPCENLISQVKYAEKATFAEKILLGKTRELEREIQQRMNNFAEDLMFEEAAKERNKLQILQEYNAKQKMVTTELVDRDIFVLARDGELACTLVFIVREGKLIGKRRFIVLKAEEKSDSDLLSRTLERWYIETDFIPDEILLSVELEEMEYLSDWLTEKKGKSLKISIPKQGDKRKMIEMAETNANLALKEHLSMLDVREQAIPRPVASLERDLRLPKPPRIIECFDNSHLQGTDLVSSMVYFSDGKPEKSQYRKFKNKTTLRNDDYAAMKEAVSRRYKAILIAMGEIVDDDAEISNDKKVPKRLPDLIIIDGGKGQLSAACEVLSELGILGKISIIGLAKRLEEVFFPGESEPRILPKTSSSLRLLQAARDEAHRFAITYHRTLRDKRTFKTSLTEIEGIGEATAQKLLKRYGSVHKIREASRESLITIITEKQADNIISYFKQIE